MKKLLTILLACCMGAFCITAHAEPTFETTVNLCYAGEEYALDMVYETAETEQKITDVQFHLEGAMTEWNYVESEKRLYLGVAAAYPIAISKQLATITTASQADFTPISAVVNGKLTDGVFTEHAAVHIPDVPPGCETPGSTGGVQCARCGIRLEAPQEIAPTGPIVHAQLDTNGTLTVNGQLADSETVPHAVLLGCYDSDNTLIAAEEISHLNQSDFTVSIQGCAAVATIKIFRWDLASLQPRYDVVVRGVS